MSREPTQPAPGAVLAYGKRDLVRSVVSGGRDTDPGGTTVGAATGGATVGAATGGATVGAATGGATVGAATGAPTGAAGLPARSTALPRNRLATAIPGIARAGGAGLDELAGRALRVAR